MINDDAMVWLDEHPGLWDVIIVDFPDPNTFALGKLYTTLFYSARSRGSRPAVPSSCRRRRRCSRASRTGASSRRCARPGFVVQPYQVTVPSFGVWGYALARARRRSSRRRTSPNVALRYLNDAGARARCSTMPADMTPVPVEINQLDNQALVRYYEREWRRVGVSADAPRVRRDAARRADRACARVRAAAAGRCRPAR